MCRFIKQALKFFGVSGIGWLLDFSIYNLLGLFGIPFDKCNFLSSICGVTFVFFVSIRKIFKVNLKRFSLWQKYVIYIIYQIFMISIASKCVGMLSNYFLMLPIGIPTQLVGIGAKICITPLTMICNFAFMKLFCEKA